MAALVRLRTPTIFPSPVSTCEGLINFLRNSSYSNTNSLQWKLLFDSKSRCRLRSLDLDPANQTCVKTSLSSNVHLPKIFNYNFCISRPSFDLGHIGFSHSCTFKLSSFTIDSISESKGFQINFGSSLRKTRASKFKQDLDLDVVLGYRSTKCFSPSPYSFKTNVETHSKQRCRFFSTSRSSKGHGIPEKLRQCWKCSISTNPKEELFFCKCGVVQEIADNLTYFDLLQEEFSFDLNEKRLGTKFRNTQKLLHPDKFSSKPKREQILAEEQSSLINKAYQTLLRPLKRAIYMLKLKGVTIDEKDSISDPAFLMDIMSINEQISEASNTSDMEQIETSNNDMIAGCLKDISEAFKHDRVQEAKTLTIKLRYYITIQERIREIKRRKLG